MKDSSTPPVKSIETLEARIKDLLLEKDNAERDAEFWKEHARWAKRQKNKLSELVNSQAAKIRKLKARLA